MLSRLRSVSHDLAVAAIGGTIVAVLATGTAVAVSTTAVSITNPTAGKRAHVTNQSSLVTSERDAVSGTYARVDATGRALVSDLPGKPWNTGDGMVLTPGDGWGALAKTVGGGRIALTSLTFAVTSGGAGVVRGDVVVFTSTSKTFGCESFAGGPLARREEFAFFAPTGQTTHLTWPTPLVYGSGVGTICLGVSTHGGPSGWALTVGANGFFI